MISFQLFNNISNEPVVEKLKCSSEDHDKYRCSFGSACLKLLPKDDSESYSIKLVHQVQITVQNFHGIDIRASSFKHENYDSSFFLLVKKHMENVGFVCFHFFLKECIVIDWIFINNEERSKGLAGCLISLLQDFGIMTSKRSLPIIIMYNNELDCIGMKSFLTKYYFIESSKHENNDNSEALRRVLAASFKHQSDNSIRPTLAAYLTRKKSRFIFSHEFAWCPLQDLKTLLSGEVLSFGVTFYNKQPSFQCYALHYLCRPQSLEKLSPFDFYSKYKIVYASKTAIANGGEYLRNTPHFMHPSHDYNTNTCKQLAVKRDKRALVKIQQNLFADAANFQCNILTDHPIQNDETELYSQMVVLLFLPFRCEDDLKIENSYNKCLQHAYSTGILTESNCQFLQNIQDCKSNQFRFTIKNDDLDRATEPFHAPIHDIFEHDDEGDMVMNGTMPDEENLGNINLAEILLLTRTGDDIQQIDLENNDNTFFNLNTIWDRGEQNCGHSHLPTTNLSLEEDSLLRQQNNFIQTLMKVLKK